MTRDTDDATAASDEPLLTLPESLRSELKDPLGPIETDASDLLAQADGPIVAVGDVVTYHLREAGHEPAIALVDGRTKRSAVDEEIREAVTTGATLEVVNPPAAITVDLLEALCAALEAPEPTTILVDGEEDLATLPAIVAAPEGAHVVYGQPDEGMVLVEVDEEVREEVRSLLERFEGDHERLWTLLE
ncbi:GTP-dependent dephospho-CoA kinase family protein [Natrialbaceae archaeon AArc-T1-2]|uniref:GTP-dependent dephospho-CoA kinase family protein n=1 Tax=Natrialbaceae archaeon AArc-T1-2 TaxID=3053904 RepID=UPI00255A9BEA|nr:GTP-dependent dephospho-CoA kinase family protein [Natrialbaceae archaeon AArc-T1-2]WIV66453.1 GTP-dependent dephospho-CoA kinase family protein [Natrialbaceae archaeon AArc-T1-2]